MATLFWSSVESAFYEDYTRPSTLIIIWVFCFSTTDGVAIQEFVIISSNNVDAMDLPVIGS